jgi:hypothetical protein
VRGDGEGGGGGGECVRGPSVCQNKLLRCPDLSPGLVT